jgi:photosystem II stability/assembly factor-like uncharacterized protein
MNPTSLSRSRTRLWLAAGLPFVLILASMGCETTNNTTAPLLPPLVDLAITPPGDTLRVNEQLQFTATAHDTAGGVITSGFQWSTSDGGVIAVNGSGRVTAVGEGNAFVIASGGGLSDSSFVSVFPDTGWFVQASAANNANLFGVYFQPDGRNGWAVGDAGTIVHTEDAGASWSRQTSNTSFNLRAVWFTSSNEGWAVGGNGTVLKTTNGGDLWSRLNNSLVNTGETLNDIVFATPDTGWAVGTNGVILRTFDRGASWQLLNNTTSSSLTSVAFAGTRDGWAVGAGGTILGTHNRGLSWFIVQPSITIQNLASVARRSEPNGWAVGDQGVAPRTIQLPADTTKWELDNAGAQFQLKGVFFASDQIGYAVGTNAGQGAILRTDDSGITWDTQASHSNQTLNDVYFVDPLRGWAVGNLGMIVHTARGGLH